jgi:hypothetical protein
MIRSTNAKMTTAKTVLASSVLLGMAFGTAHAEVCYQLTPFIDVLRLAETTFADPAVGASHTLVVGDVIAPGVYTVPVAGSLELGLHGDLRLALHGVNHSAAAFGNHVDCIYDGVPGGAEVTTCDGRVAGIFTAGPATLTPISCVGVPASDVAVPGKAQGGP